MFVLVVIVTILLGCIGLATLLAWLFARNRTIWLDPRRKRLRAYRCKYCDGCGVQWLDPSDTIWKPIPRELRMFDGTRDTFVVDESKFPGFSQTDRVAFNTSARLANVRRCHGCNGLLHVWDYPRWRSAN